VGGTRFSDQHEIMPYRMAMNSKLHEGVDLTVYCRNGWGPGGSNPKAAQPCCCVYVVDLVRFEMGPFIRVGTSRLPHNLSVLVNCFCYFIC